MAIINDIAVSRAIVEAYNARLLAALDVDVLIAGAGPSGMVAGAVLAERGLRVTIVEKRLSVGGGIWGGGLMMPIVAVQPAAEHILEKFSIRRQRTREGLLTVDACELASGLCVGCVRAGAHLLTLMTIEDVRLQKNRVTGLVVNRTNFGPTPLPVDPITLAGKAVVDQTGHEMVVAAALVKRGLKLSTTTGGLVGEQPMDADAGERFVVDKTGEIYPGLYVAGMSVCAACGGPRMGPIFGGMLLSGEKVADLIARDLGK
jgi:thiazole biosynthesis enzyme